MGERWEGMQRAGDVRAGRVHGAYRVQRGAEAEVHQAFVTQQHSVLCQSDNRQHASVGSQARGEGRGRV